MAISFVQYASAEGAGTSIIAHFPSPISAGSFIAVSGLVSSSGTSITFSTDKGDAYTDSSLGTFSDGSVGGGILMRIGGFLSPTAGAQNVTMSSSGSSGFSEVVIWNVTGITSPVIDKAVFAAGTSASPSSGSTGTLSAAAEFAVSYGIVDSTAYNGVPGSGWTLNEVTGFQDETQYQITSSNAAISATGTLTGASAWVQICCTFMAGGSPPPASVLNNNIRRLLVRRPLR